MTRLPLFCCALIVLAVRGYAQPAAPVVRLTQPELEHPLGFTSVLSVAELSGDKAIVVARDPAGPSLVDLRSGGLLAIGHKGQGPGEWAVIMGVFGATGDTAFLFDAGRGVVMSVVGRGWPSQVGRATGNVVQVDTALRAYYVGVGGAIAMAAAASASTGRAMVAAQAVGDRRDSMAIVRVDLRANKRDTIGYRRYEQGWGSVSAPVSADGTEPIGSAGAGFSGPGVFGSHTPFDLVAAARDGRVALLRQPEYRVEWIQPDGRRIIGPPIPHTRA